MFGRNDRHHPGLFVGANGDSCWDAVQNRAGPDGTLWTRNQSVFIMRRRSLPDVSDVLELNGNVVGVLHVQLLDRFSRDVLGKFAQPRLEAAGIQELLRAFRIELLDTQTDVPDTWLPPGADLIDADK
jgi:hypothetical protein